MPRVAQARATCRREQPPCRVSRSNESDNVANLRISERAKHRRCFCCPCCCPARQQAPQRERTVYQVLARPNHQCAYHCCCFATDRASSPSPCSPFSLFCLSSSFLLLFFFSFSLLRAMAVVDWRRIFELEHRRHHRRAIYLSLSLSLSLVTRLTCVVARAISSPKPERS